MDDVSTASQQLEVQMADDAANGVACMRGL